MPILLCPAESGQTSEPPGCSRIFFRHQPRVFLDTIQNGFAAVLKPRRPQMWFCKGTISNRRKRGAAHVGSSWFEQLKLFQSIHPYTRVAGACLVLQTLTFERGFYYQTWGGGSSANLSLMVHVWFPICWTPCLEGFLQTFSVLCLLVVHWELGSDMKIWARALRRGKAKKKTHLSLLFGNLASNVGRFPDSTCGWVRDPMESPEMISFDEDGRDFGSKVFGDVWCKSEDSDACAFGECFLFQWTGPPTKSLARGVNWGKHGRPFEAFPSPLRSQIEMFEVWNANGGQEAGYEMNLQTLQINDIEQLLFSMVERHKKRVMSLL